VALIGPFAKATVANHGFWAVAFSDDSTRIVSQYEGIKQQLEPSSTLLYAKGCNENDQDKSGFDEAVQTALKADVVIMTLGEGPAMSGEAKSRSNIHFSGVQEELLKAVAATGKPIVLMINAGRPLVFDWAVEHVPTIVYSWWLGTEAGNSIADVLFGKINPSGKLPMTFPRSEGQIPIYYNHYSTGRPARSNDDKIYVSAYIDQQNDPQFPFGFGLSYTTFDFSNLSLSSSVLAIKSGQLTVAVDVKNTGKYDGEEVVQLYVRDLVGSVVRPVKELKGFKKIFLKSGETRKVELNLTAEDLKFYNDKLQYINEPGEYELYVGNSSQGGLMTKFTLK
jgi:beta-glucosidase